MIIEKFNLKAQEAIERACRLAVQKDHRYVTPWHVLYALLEPKSAVVRDWLAQAGTDPSLIAAKVDARLLAEAKALVGSQQTPISRDLERVFVAAEQIGTQLNDRYLGAQHLLLGMLELADFATLFEDAGGRADALKTVLQQQPKAGYQAANGSGDFEYLAKYSRDLTELARQGQLDPVLGRDSEIKLAIQVLCRRIKNNPIVVGEPGVGKTAIVEGLAQRIVAGDVPESLRSCALLAIDMGLLVAGAKYRGEFEERFRRLLQDIVDAGNVIAFIDEIHTLIGAGGAEGAMDAANLLKPALARGEIRCIGATTLEEFRKHFEQDAALVRRFQMVDVAEPSPETALTMLRGIKKKYELHHGVRIGEAALRAAVHLAHRYITDRYLPDKAIDLIDQSAATLRIGLSAKPSELDGLDRRIVDLEIELHALGSDEAVERQVELHAELDELRTASRTLTERWQREVQAVAKLQSARKTVEEARAEMAQKIQEEDFVRVAELQHKIIPQAEAILAEYADLDTPDLGVVKSVVDADDVAATASRLTGIPVAKMLDSEQHRLLELEHHLAQRVVGQTAAISAIARAVRRARANLQDGRRPLGSFLMLGPTGVGKTELAKALAEFLFDDDTALVRFDMSEFMEKHAAARLTGAPPGYVGYEEGGLLTNRIRRKPYSVVLFDEVEKAHPDVFNLFLQMLDDGRLTDSHGRVANFANTIILMTSNLGAEHIEPTADAAKEEAMRQRIMQSVRGHFRPELLNRLDDILIFSQLTLEAMRPIADLQLGQLARRLAESDIVLRVSDPARDRLAEWGFNPLYGARPLKRVLQTKVQDPLAEHLLKGQVRAGQTLVVDLADEELIFNGVDSVPDQDAAQSV